MNVFHLTPFLGYAHGGAEIITREIIAHDHRPGTVVTLRGGLEHIKCAGKALHLLHLPALCRERRLLHHLYRRLVLFAPSVRRDTRTLNEITSNWALDGALRRCDVIHCHTVHWLGIAHALGVRYRKPVVATCHDVLPRNLPVGVRPRSPVGLLVRRNLDRQWRQLAQILPAFHRIIYQTQAACHHLTRALPLDNVECVPHWVEAKPHYSAKPRHTIPLWSGRLDHNKGFGWLLDHYSGPLSILSGGGPLIKHALERGLAVNRVPHDMVQDYMRDHEVFIFTSLMEECAPLTLLEARAAGCKILAFSDPITREMLNGYPGTYWISKHHSIDSQVKAALAHPLPRIPEWDFLALHSRTYAMGCYAEIYESAKHETKS